MEGSDQEQTIGSMPTAWQHDKVLSDCMIELYENKLWTDIKFRCSNHYENERIHAHKVVLAARSPVFQAMFFGPCTELKEEIVLDNIEAEIFDLFLRFVYQDKVNLTEDTAVSVLETAHYYHVTKLVLHCAHFLTSCITSQNVCEILSIAKHYEVIRLCQACCAFIDDNANSVMNSEGFLKLTEDTLAYILEGDTFYANEVEILRKVEEWAQKKKEDNKRDYEGKSMREVLGACFFHLRIPTLTFDNILKCTRRKGYFSREEYEDIANFINTTPGATVTSNSCTRRLLKEEHVNFTSNEIGRSELKDKIETSFTVSVIRDVKVKTITLTKILPYLKYGDQHLRSVIDEHRPRYFHDFGKFCCLYTLREIIPKMPCGIEAVLLGSLKVTCHKGKANVEAGTSNKEVNEDGKSDDGQHGFDSDNNGSDDDDYDNDDARIDDEDNNKNGEVLKEYVVFQKEFMLTNADTIDLEESLPLDKTRSPYTFELSFEFRNGSSVQMETVGYSETSFTSQHGVIRVDNVYGSFEGIETLSFEHISNRDM